MLKTILLPLDGSPLAERAVAYASALARRTGAELLLVQAVRAHTLPGIDPSESQIECTESAELYLDSIASRVGMRGVVATCHVYYDDPVSAILDASHRHHVDMIVMSTHGRGGLGRMLYGSVADQILRRASVPVLLVPSSVDHAWSADGPETVVIALDGSALSEQALTASKVLTEAFRSKLTLLRVVQPLPYPLYGDGYAFAELDENAEVAEARSYLAQRAGSLEADGLTVETRVVLGEPARVIGTVARDLSADVVVMATHGIGGLGRLLLGSVASATLHRSTAPLLLVRPSAGLNGDEHEPSLSPLSLPTSPERFSELLTDGSSTRSVDVPLTPAELELIEHSLRALGHAPGYTYADATAARSLADRLKAIAAGPAPVP